MVWDNMGQGTGHRRAVRAAVAGGARHSFTIESLERRALFSAGPVTTLAADVVLPLVEWPRAAAMQQPLVSAKAKTAAPGILDCVGTWTGTFTNNANRKVGSFSVTFTRQKGVAVTGTFELSQMMGTSVLTTATVQKNRALLAICKSGKDASHFTASVSANGQVITGRWSSRTAKGWSMGVFQLQRVA